MYSRQKSFADMKYGMLYLVPTPVGNLQDMTFRAVDTLKSADYIACEDTRQTRKLLNHFQIDKRLVSYHEHNKRVKGKSIVEDIRSGKIIAYVTDAGMPALSDPGADLAQSVIDQGLAVVSLPGANAALPALVASGLPTAHFLFYGFLDRNEKKRKDTLHTLKYVPYSLIFYEAPHRLRQTLTAIRDVFGDRLASLVRELSKKHEEYLRGSITDLLRWSDEEKVRGELTLVVSGHGEETDYRKHLHQQQAPPWWNGWTLEEHVAHYVKQGTSKKEAIKDVAKERGVSKRDVYQAYHVGKHP